MDTNARNAAVAATGPTATDETLDADELQQQLEQRRKEREQADEVSREKIVLAQIINDVNTRQGYHGDDDTAIVYVADSIAERYASTRLFTYGGKMYVVSVSEQALYGFEVQTMAAELAARNGHKATMHNVDNNLVGSVGVCTECEQLLRLSVRHGPNDAIIKWCPRNDDDEHRAF